MPQKDSDIVLIRETFAALDNFATKAITAALVAAPYVISTAAAIGLWVLAMKWFALVNNA
jgi:hypothetical protein